MDHTADVEQAKRAKKGEIMNRRTLLRGVLGTAAGAAVAAVASERASAAQPATMTLTNPSLPVITVAGPYGGSSGFSIVNHTPMVSGELVARDVSGSVNITGQLVQGPDPSTYVYVEWGPDDRVAVIPRTAPSPWPDQMVQGMGIPRSEFPEFDERHGVVFLADDPHMVRPDAWTDAMIRAHYIYTVAHRTPMLPFDGNHLSVKFMPHDLQTVLPRLNDEDAMHVTESYDGPDGWIVQMVTDSEGRVVVFGDSLRYRIATGNVEHWVNGERVHPGAYTASLLSR